jgi:hypothetical protein
MAKIYKSLVNRAKGFASVASTYCSEKLGAMSVSDALLVASACMALFSCGLIYTLENGTPEKILIIVQVFFSIVLLPLVWRTLEIGSPAGLQTRRADSLNLTTYASTPNVTIIRFAQVRDSIPPPEGLKKITANNLHLYQVLQVVKNFIESPSVEWPGLIIDTDFGRFAPIRINGNEKLARQLAENRPRIPIGIIGTDVSLPPEKEQQSHEIFILVAEAMSSEGTLHVDALRINTLEVKGDVAGLVTINNCWINEIILSKNVGAKSLELVILSSKIGWLRFRGGQVRRLEIYNSDIGMIEYASNSGVENPVTGLFTHSGRSRLAVGERHFRRDRIQEYRDFRVKTSEVTDTNTSSVLRAIELRAERKFESIFVRLTSFLFDFFVSYGNVPERSLVFALMIMAYNGVFFGLSGSWAVSGDSCDGGSGLEWVGTLCERNVLARINAAILIGLQPLMNPLSPLHGGQVISVTNLPGALWLWVSHVAVLLLLAATVIGIRKRMKA